MIKDATPATTPIRTVWFFEFSVAGRGELVDTDPVGLVDDPEVMLALLLALGEILVLVMTVVLASAIVVGEGNALDCSGTSIEASTVPVDDGCITASSGKAVCCAARIAKRSIESTGVGLITITIPFWQCPR